MNRRKFNKRFSAIMNAKTGTEMESQADTPLTYLQVCALLSGGGYAEKVAVPAVQLFPIPKGIKLQDAAGIPEVACTVWSTIFMTCHLKKGENLLV